MCQPISGCIKLSLADKRTQKRSIHPTYYTGICGVGARSMQGTTSSGLRWVKWERCIVPPPLLSPGSSVLLRVGRKSQSGAAAAASTTICNGHNGDGGGGRGSGETIRSLSHEKRMEEAGRRGRTVNMTKIALGTRGEQKWGGGRTIDTSKLGKKCVPLSTRSRRWVVLLRCGDVEDGWIVPCFHGQLQSPEGAEERAGEAKDNAPIRNEAANAISGRPRRRVAGGDGRPPPANFGSWGTSTALYTRGRDRRACGWLAAPLSGARSR